MPLIHVYMNRAQTQCSTRHSTQDDWTVDDKTEHAVQIPVPDSTYIIFDTRRAILSIFVFTGAEPKTALLSLATFDSVADRQLDRETRQSHLTWREDKAT